MGFIEESKMRKIKKIQKCCVCAIFFVISNICLAHNKLMSNSLVATFASCSPYFSSLENILQNG